MRVGDRAVGGDHERARPLGNVAALRIACKRALPRRAKKALRKLWPDVLLCRSPLQPDGVVGLTLGIAEAVKRHVALAAEVVGRIRSVLEHGDDIRAGRPEVFIVLAQLDELFAAERSAEVAHERHHEGRSAVAVGEIHFAFPRLEPQFRELVSGIQGHAPSL